MIDCRKHIVYSILAIGITLLVFEFTPLDMIVQNKLFDFSAGNWIVDRDQAVSHFIFYDGVKMVLVQFYVGLLVLLLVSFKTGFATEYRRGIGVVLLTMALAPSIVHELKEETNMACPRNLQRYTGHVVYKKLFETYSPDNRPDKPSKCFPAAHASGGYALLSLYFLAAGAVRRRWMLALALTVGTLMGGYKMLIGDHFLSHTVVSMELCWLVSCIFASVMGFAAEADADPVIAAIESDMLQNQYPP